MGRGGGSGVTAADLLPRRPAEPAPPPPDRCLTRVCRFVEQRPAVSCGAVWLLWLGVAAGAIPLLGRIELDSDFDGFREFDHPTFRREQVYQAAASERTTPVQSSGRHARPMQQEQEPRVADYWYLDLLYFGNNLLDPEVFGAIADYEHALTRDKAWQDAGWLISPERVVPISSIALQYVYPTITGDKWLFDGNGTRQDPVAAVQRAAARAASGQGDWFVSKDFNGETSTVLRSEFIIGAPVEGFSSVFDRLSDQEDVVLQRMRALVARFGAYPLPPGVSIAYGGSVITEAEISDSLLADALFAIASLGAIFVYSAVYLRSPALALGSTLLLVLAFPLAMLVYIGAFGETYIGPLHVLSLYISIGIGVDDCFVLAEAYDTPPNPRPTQPRTHRLPEAVLRALPGELDDAPYPPLPPEPRRGPRPESSLRCCCSAELLRYRPARCEDDTGGTWDLSGSGPAADPDDPEADCAPTDGQPYGGESHAEEVGSVRAAARGSRAAPDAAALSADLPHPSSLLCASPVGSPSRRSYGAEGAATVPRQTCSCGAAEGGAALTPGARLEMALRRAGVATLVTTVTGAAAFSANAVSLLPAVRSFGIAMALLVVANWLLAVTAWPATLCLHTYLAGRMGCGPPPAAPGEGGHNEDVPCTSAPTAASCPTTSVLWTVRRGRVAAFDAAGADRLLQEPERGSSSPVRAMFDAWLIPGVRHHAPYLLAFAIAVTLFGAVVAGTQLEQGGSVIFYSESKPLQRYLSRAGYFGTSSYCRRCAPYFTDTDYEGKCWGEGAEDPCGICGGDGSTCATPAPPLPPPAPPSPPSPPPPSPPMPPPVYATPTPDTPSPARQTPVPDTPVPASAAGGRRLLQADPTPVPQTPSPPGQTPVPDTPSPGVSAAPTPVPEQCSTCDAVTCSARGGSCQGTWCVGCDGTQYCGQPASQVDACGVCGGGTKEWPVGEQWRFAEPDATCKGCDGVLNSPMKYDRCGTCGGDDDCYSVGPGGSMPNDGLVRMVYGLADTGLGAPTLESRGGVVFDTAFNIEDAGCQTHLLTACSAIEQGAATSYCIPELLHLRLQSKFGGKGLPVDPQLFRDELSEMLRDDLSSLASDVGWWGNPNQNPTPRIKYLIIRQPLSVTVDSSITARVSEYNMWGRRISAANAAAPPNCLIRFQTAKIWPQTWAEALLVDSILKTILIALMASFCVVLVATCSVRITVIVLSVMGCIVAATLGVFWWIGWEVGPVEAVAFSVVIGIAVDACIHVAQVFVEDSDAAARYRLPFTRSAAADDALRSVGPPLLSAGLTTVLSTALLFGAVLRPLRQFGLTMVVAVSLSLVFAATAFIPALHLLAPERPQLLSMRRRLYYIAGAAAAAGLTAYVAQIDMTTL